MNQPNLPTRQPGEIIGKRYKLGESLGRGAFAEVFVATDLVLERQVAVKMLSPQFRAQPNVSMEQVRRDTVTRFYKEARLIARLRDHNNVTMYDFGNTEDGALYMAMEFVNGRSLRQLIDQDAPLDPERVATILIQTLRGLREAHTYGLLHRDIKPENILVFDQLGDRDQVRVLDFGIAKTLEDEASELTAAGVLVGTPRYVAPERITTRELRPASDIYSLGVVAYELLCGEEAYPGMNAMSLIRAQASPESLRLPAHCSAPLKLRQIVEKTLEKDLTRRYTSAQQVINDLEQFQHEQIAQRVGSGALAPDMAHTIRHEAIVGPAPDQPMQAHLGWQGTTQSHEPVVAPAAPVSPDERLKFTALGLALGVGLGLVLGFLIGLLILR